MKQIIIEKSSLKDWDFSAVIVRHDGRRDYIYFNDPSEIVKEIEQLTTDGKMVEIRELSPSKEDMKNA